MIKNRIKPTISKNESLQKTTSKFYQKFCSFKGRFHSLPDFLIIGFERCGTTSMYEYLIQHPQVEPALTKEIHFFDKYYTRGINWYKSCFISNRKKNNSNGALLCGEASPTYILNPKYAERIKKTIPEIKLIILVRNPIDRAFSHYNRALKLKKETLTFENAIDQEEIRTKSELDKINKNEFYFSDDYRRFAYLQNGIYVDKIKHWMSVFPKEQFLIIQTEEFQKDTSKVYNQVLEFLGLPKWELSKYSKFRENLLKSEMNHVTREKLIQYFKPHNKRLYDFLGREFNWEK